LLGDLGRAGHTSPDLHLTTRHHLDYQGLFAPKTMTTQPYPATMPASQTAVY